MDILKNDVTITVVKTDSDLYYREFDWNTKATPKRRHTTMVIGNYPTSVDRVWELDQTTFLALNNVREQKSITGMVMANVYTRPIKGTSERALSSAFAQDAIEIIAARAQQYDVKEIIVAVGSLYEKSKLTRERFAELKSILARTGNEEQLLMLVDSHGTANHPLAPSVRNSWQTLPFISL